MQFDAAIRTLAATPSGDRFYAALDDRSEISVLDRYSNSVAGTVPFSASSSGAPSTYSSGR